MTLLDSFGVTFGAEGESVSLVANIVVVPDLPNLPPEAMWYRDGEMLHFSFGLEPLRNFKLILTLYICV